MFNDRFILNHTLIRLLNIGIRGGTVLGRFVLIIFLAKVLPEADMGKFGIFVATVLLCVLVVGLEFNKYMYRELFASGMDVRAKVLGSHVKTIVTLFFLSAPLMYGVFFFGLIESRYVVYFYSVVCFVLISMELQALLTVLGNQLLSSMVYFVQTSSWVFVVIPVLYLFPAYRTLDFIYIAWGVGAFVSISIALLFLRYSNILIDFNGMGGAWIVRGLKKCIVFLLSSLMLKLLFTVDRYAVEYYSTPELVGVYVFYVSVVMGIFNFLEPAVFSFIYPKLLRFYKEGNQSAYAIAHRELVCATIVGVFVIGVFLYFSVPCVIDVLSLDAYRSNLDSLWLLILAAGVFMLGYVPHYVLFSRGDFSWLSYSNAAALFAFSLAIYSLSTSSVIDLLAGSLLVAFLVGGGVKLCGAYFFQYRRPRYAK
ncbi:hypothetical protein [Pseudomonas sp. BNK-15]|uniref:hypothetical protein n=1 Tax=Pseudomonas sp. BNK-15 TaxID=3376152 RepID=UPI0039BF6A51